MKTFLFLVLVLYTFSAGAQLEKGSHLGGLQTTLAAGDMYAVRTMFVTGSSRHEYGLSLVPTYGYALACNWLIGATATLGLGRETNTFFDQTVFHYTDLGIAPFTRFYLDLGKSRYKLFGLASVEFASARTKYSYPNSTSSVTYNSVTGVVGGGFGYFGRKIALDANVSGAGLRIGVYKTFGAKK